MSDIWQLLGLEGPTHDIRAIKRAYAKAIKVARPDEHPEQFQAINSAYKQAQRIARQQASRTAEVQNDVPDAEQLSVSEPSLEIAQERVVIADMPVAQTTPPYTEPESAPVYEPEPVVQTAPKDVEPNSEVDAIAEEALPHSEPVDDDASEDPQEIMRAAFIHLLDQVDQLLNSPAEFSDDRNWRFVERSPFLLDDEFNWHFCMALFERILTHNNENKDNPTQQLRNVRVFSYLDQFVDWRGREDALVHEFSEEHCRPYLDALQRHARKDDPLEAVKGGADQQPYTEDKYANLNHYFLAGRLGRTFANIIDLVGGTFALGFLNYFIPTEGLFVDKTLFTVIGIILMFLVMESSSLQASPGKLLLGYRVVRKDMSPVPWWQNIWRILCYILATVGIKITIWMNLFLGDRIVHDRMSGTMVVDIRKSYNKHQDTFEIKL